MNTVQMVLSGVTLLVYCGINATVLAGLFNLARPALSFMRTWPYLLVKTMLSVVIVFSFFALILHMFCWTASIGECLQCICPVITVDTFIMQSNMPSTILFFVSVSFVQMALIAIPRGLLPLTFVAMTGASNLIASLLKLGIISLWA